MTTCVVPPASIIKLACDDHFDGGARSIEFASQGLAHECQTVVGRGFHDGVDCDSGTICNDLLRLIVTRG